jgi:hypothetical protein
MVVAFACPVSGSRGRGFVTRYVGPVVGRFANPVAST